MAKKKNSRSQSGKGKNDSSNSTANNSNDIVSDRKGDGDSVDLLELGPDDGQELLEFEGSSHQQASIKVIGVGGGGGNALNTMIASGLSGVEFIAANTDAQALSHNKAATKVQLGAEITRGLGCGANPDRGRAAALEARDRLRELLEGSDMVFVTAGMGGGTGTGAAPIIAEVAREVGALTVGVVTKPFPFEGRVRMKHAGHGIDELHGVVDTLITIPNQRLLALAGKGTAVRDAFSIADQVLLNAVRGISDLITIHGLINLDFADVRTVMNEAGVALMGTGVGKGDTRAIDAAAAAISSPLLEDLSIEGARGVLINITGGSEMTLFEVNEASSLVHEAAHEDANIIVGAVIDETLGDDELRVTVIATGLDNQEVRRTPPQPRRRVQDPAAEIEHERAMVDAPSFTPNVTHIRQDPAAPAMTGMSPDLANDPNNPEAPQPPVEQQQVAAAGGQKNLHMGQNARDTAICGIGFESPFEDEYDTPAFLRNRSGGADDDPSDRDVPAFMRRGGSD
ncbi:MAG TPA: cell division protein FtsZ [Myxococcales bacterium]|nr:cell division protein FtsZ [Myxococcales bacterium]HIK84417.1 cell division protein FtsZ [Myxococcales bacterium]